MSAPALGAGTTVAGGHRITRFLGATSQGELYEATAPDGARVWLRLLTGTLGATAGAGGQPLDRLLAELRATARLVHPRIVPVRDVGIDPASGALCVVTPPAEGELLEPLVLRAGPLDPAVAARVAIEIAVALAYAHAVGVVHRDVAPGHVVLARTDGGDVAARLSGFGLAKPLDESAAPGRGARGTIAFRSPELLQASASADPRADVWGLASTLYFLLAGRPPVPDVRTPEEHARAVASMAPLSTLAPWVDPALQRAVLAGLTPDPARRYPTIAHFAAALRPFALAGPLSASHLGPVTPELRARTAGAAPWPADFREVLPQEAWTAPPPVEDPAPPRAFAAAPAPPVAKPGTSPARIAAFVLLLAVGAGFGALFATGTLKSWDSPTSFEDGRDPHAEPPPSASSPKPAKPGVPPPKRR